MPQNSSPKLQEIMNNKGICIRHTKIIGNAKSWLGSPNLELFLLFPMSMKVQYTDKDIFKRSGILNRLNEGDLVMVGRIFNIRDLLLKKGADSYSSISGR